MISAKVKIKAKGQHAEQLLQQIPNLGSAKVQVQTDKPKALISRKRPSDES